MNFEEPWTKATGEQKLEDGRDAEYDGRDAEQEDRGKAKVGELVNIVCCEEGYAEKQNKMVGHKDSEARR